MPNVVHDPVLAALREGRPALGLAVRVAIAPELARIARGAGLDFLYIDLQHAMADPRDVVALIHACLGTGVAPLVRVASADDPDLHRVLDNGALGVVVPGVETADQARAIVDRARFPPLGRRSYSSSLPFSDYVRTTASSAMAEAEPATLVICMIESRAGLDHADEIAGVPGVSGLYVGANDLAAETGLDSDGVDSAVRTVAATARRHGGVAGCGGIASPERQRDAVSAGVDLITLTTDIALLSGGSTRSARLLRDRTPEA